MNSKEKHFLDSFLDLRLDEDFKKVNGLNCFPWIGKGYIASENKILLVGESSYAKSDSQLKEHFNNTNYTREIIAGDYNTKYYNNMFNALLGGNKFNKNSFWNLVSFYNIVQRPMNYIDPNRDQPNEKDFQDGWRIYYRIIEILKPETVIFFGLNSVVNFQDDTLNNWNRVSFKQLNKIGANYPRSIVLKDGESNEVNMLFVKHPSRYFSHSRWHEFLKEKIPTQINHLQNICIDK